VIDVAANPQARQELVSLGMRNMPVVAKGGKYHVAKRMDQLAKFVGVDILQQPALPPAELIERWLAVLRAAQRSVRQIPEGQLSGDATHLRKKSLRLVCHHIFNLGDVYLECLAGAKDLAERSRIPPADGTCTNTEEIVHYGDEVIARLESWWRTFADKTCSARLEIDDYGVLSIHQLLERCTWHSAHHVRQIADVLEHRGIPPQGKLTAAELAGLPLPAGIWD